MNPLCPITLLSVLLVTGASAQEKDVKGEKPATKPTATALKVGDTVDAALKLKDIDGKELSFKDLRDKVVFIHFWSTTCPWEKEAEPKIEKIETDYAKKDVVVLAINSNQGEIGKEGETAKGGDGETTYPKVRKKLADLGAKFRVFVDHGNKISDLFQAATTPHSFVIDKKGVLRYAGALDGANDRPKSDKPYVKNAIDDVLAGKEVTEKQTKPYG